MLVILTAPPDPFGVAGQEGVIHGVRCTLPLKFVLSGIGLHTEVELETERLKFSGGLASRHIFGS
jgi:hypothetical protein